MKKLFATLFISSLGLSAFGQVSFAVIEPASIAGGYPFTSNGDGTNWGLPNLLDPADAVMDTLMLVDDGTPGTNAQGIPFANEGCGTLVNDLTGKIAVVYRYDGVSSNVCWYGTKVLNAQNAGAVGVIMINREDALIDVPGTTDGPLTNIPFAFISKSDGEILRARMDAGEDVIAFIGNKLGLFGDDVGINKEATLVPPLSATPTHTAQNATEFNFDVGTQVYNYGSNAQNNVMVTATVTGPGGTWSDMAGPFNIPVGDSIDVYTGGTNNLNQFSFANYPPGRYTLEYSIDLGISDELVYDNTLSYDFVITDSLFSYSVLDTLTNLPVSNANYRPGGGSTTYKACMNYDNANGSRVAADGIYFSAVTGYQSGVSLDGEEIPLYLYRWEDVFTDLNDVNLAFDNLNAVGFGYYYYPGDLQDEVVYAPFDAPVQLEDNQRYLACIEVNNADIYIGYNTGIDYIRNANHYLQPLCPIASDAGWFALGFGADLSPAMALQVFDASLLSTEDMDKEKGYAYPNPSTDILNVRLTNSSNGTFRIIDITGRTVLETHYSDFNSTIDIETIHPGNYTLQFNDTEGNSGVIPFIKK